ncbi:MAG: hypothetical protein AAFY72_08940 [Cyanobacteria bacterium J06649_4]
MTQDNLVKFKTPETAENSSDASNDFVHQGSRQIIAQAVTAEPNEFLNQYAESKG